eukprot:1051082-Pleurochrysis_carterae.AAC.2
MCAGVQRRLKVYEEVPSRAKACAKVEKTSTKVEKRLRKWKKRPRKWKKRPRKCSEGDLSWRSQLIGIVEWACAKGKPSMGAQFCAKSATWVCDAVCGDDAAEGFVIAQRIDVGAGEPGREQVGEARAELRDCLLYTSDAADDTPC